MQDELLSISLRSNLFVVSHETALFLHGISDRTPFEHTLTAPSGKVSSKDVILELRTKNGWSQNELAEKIYVTRQAVSRWETGETVPNTETLKLLSKLFDVSINTLLGAPRKLICQCCGMPLDDSSISKETDGFPCRTQVEWKLASRPSKSLFWSTVAKT